VSRTAEAEVAKARKKADEVKATVGERAGKVRRAVEAGAKAYSEEKGAKGRKG